MYKLDKKLVGIAIIPVAGLIGGNADIAMQICNAAIDKGTCAFTDKHGKWHRLDWWQA